jgi:dihydroorotate dehydrogenase (fumarate)
MIKDTAHSASARPSKGFIISVTGGPEDVSQCYRAIASTQAELAIPLAMEINLSCPNIPNSPPPAYSGESLTRYLAVLSEVISASSQQLPRIPFGLKTPPYTHSTEFQTLIDALLASAPPSAPGAACPVTFITATNTLGSCLVLSQADDDLAPPNGLEPTGGGVAGQQPLVPSLPGSGLGGMAGAALHPLALGNVATLRRLLDAHADRLGHIQIIGVGGVLDGAGYRRMRAAGAYAVGVGTGLGLHGVEVFRQIERDVGGKW